jgi:hypothetical protein
MRCTEIETPVSSTDGQDVRLRKKTARIDDALQTLPANVTTPRRRRHSFVFLCTENGPDADDDDGEHFVSFLLVKVIQTWHGGTG